MHPTSCLLHQLLALSELGTLEGESLYTSPSHRLVYFAHTGLESNFFALRVLEHSNCAHCNQVVMLMALPSQEPWSFSSGGGHGNVVVAGTNSQVTFLL